MVAIDRCVRLPGTAAGLIQSIGRLGEAVGRRVKKGARVGRSQGYEYQTYF